MAIYSQPAVLLVCVLAAPACAGTEAGNPEEAPLCNSFMFGRIEGDFAVPANATGIPLQISESLRVDATATSELIVTRNGSVEVGWQLVDSHAARLDTSTQLDGLISVVFTDPLVEGDRIIISRRVTCQGSREPFELPSDDVFVTVGPQAPLPTSAGTLSVSDRGDSTSIVLSLSPELVPWMHVITASSLVVGDTHLQDGIFLEGADRDLDWTLAGVGCRPCETEPTPTTGDAPPLICYPIIWSAGQYDITVEVELLGEPGFVEPPATSTTFDATRCSQ